MGACASLADALATADLLVNATPVGTGSDESPVPMRRSCGPTSPCSTWSIARARRASCATRERSGRSARAGGGHAPGPGMAEPRAVARRAGAGRRDARRRSGPSSGTAPMPDAIVLVGLSGQRQESTVGALVAQRLGRPFVDLDARIEERARRAARRPHPDSVGEARFREIEADEPCARPRRSTAPSSRPAAARSSTRSTAGSCGTPARPSGSMLRTSCSLSRLAADDVDRPLLAGDASAALARARERRASRSIEPPTRGSMRHAHPRRWRMRWCGALAPDARTAQAPASALRCRGPARPSHGTAPRPSRARTRPRRRSAGRDRRSGQRRRPRRRRGCPSRRGPSRPRGRAPGGAAPARPLRRARTSVFAPRKRLLEAAAAMGAERGDAWIGRRRRHDRRPRRHRCCALPARRAARGRCPRRGWPMADAAIGGKVAVDLAAAKNAAGAFWPPVAVDRGHREPPAPCPRRGCLDGMAESLKSGLIGDPGLWALDRVARSRGARRPTRRRATRWSSARCASSWASSSATRSRRASGGRSTSATRSATRSRSRAATGCRTARRSCSACAPSRRSRRARRRAPTSRTRIDAVARVGSGYPLTPRVRSRASVRAALGSDKKRVRGRQRWILPMEIGQRHRRRRRHR